jgi:hypothetical protein
MDCFNPSLNSKLDRFEAAIVSICRFNPMSVLFCLIEFYLTAILLAETGESLLRGSKFFNVFIILVGASYF